VADVQWLTDDERRLVRDRLERDYRGVFGPAEIAFHLDAHVGGGFADYACQVIAAATPPGAVVVATISKVSWMRL